MCHGIRPVILPSQHRIFNSSLCVTDIASELLSILGWKVNRLGCQGTCGAKHYLFIYLRITSSYTLNVIKSLCIL